MMKNLECPFCGAHCFKIEESIAVCCYCGGHFTIEKNDNSEKMTDIVDKMMYEKTIKNHTTNKLTIIDKHKENDRIILNPFKELFDDFPNKIIRRIKIICESILVIFVVFIMLLWHMKA